MLTTSNHQCRQRVANDENDDDDDDENSNDEQEEEINVLEQVQGLFSSETFANVLDMFRAYRTQFDLVEFLRAHQISLQYDYIRLINYIRLEVNSWRLRSLHRVHIDFSATFDG